MYFSNLTKKEQLISFTISDVDVALVNSIRRTIFTDIPNVGFYFKLNEHFVDNDITISKNDSPIHNEMLSHRLSLVPLCFNVDEIENWKDEDYKFVLKKQNDTNALMNVTTKDFIILNKNNEEMPSTFSQRVFPANKFTKDHILITKLHPNIQKNSSIEISAIARKGKGKDCCCWGVVSTCAYFNVVDEECASKELTNLTEGKTAEEKKTIETSFKTLDKYRCFFKNQYGEPNAFQFSIESECKIPSTLIFKKACEILSVNFDDLVLELLKNEDSKVVDIKNLNDVPNFYIVSIKNHTHTLGNLLQSMIMNRYVRDKVDTDIYDVEYVGYNVPHPLEELMVLKIKFNKDVTHNGLREFLIKASTYIKGHIHELITEWTTFTS
jgi:DNA-directed RNA polymerase subunit L